MNDLIEQLKTIVGNKNLTTDPSEREYFSQDVYSEGVHAGVVVAPGSKEELAAVVKASVDAGAAVLARGGGMSYTSGYLPAESDSVMVDMLRMNRVLEINTNDMYVTVEGGTTWADMAAALAEHGLRTPYWGPLSGLYATVGGSMAQNSIFFGSGRYGCAADSVIGMEIVLADGSILNTGSASQVNAPPFYRHFGPDLTGIFTGDCGALGFKATVTLRLVPEMPVHTFASFAFENHQDTLNAMSEIARQDIVTECFGFDPYLQQQRMKRDRLSADIRKLGGVLKAAGGAGKAIREGAKMALAGRGFMDDVRWSFHVMIETHTDASGKACLDKAREIVEAHSGRELPGSIPRVVRANPFGPVNNMVGPEGERWVPVHGLIPHSRAVETLDSIEALFDKHREALDEHHINVGYLLATVSTNCFVIEPVFFWPDKLMEMHRRSVEPAHLKRLKDFPENLVARDVVATVRSQMTELFTELGAVHLQIGKAYRYSEGLRPESLELVKSLKTQLDPNNRINPGALGL